MSHIFENPAEDDESPRLSYSSGVDQESEPGALSGPDVEFGPLPKPLPHSHRPTVHF